MIVRVTLRAEPGADGPLMLKAALKALLRRFKLRCTRIERVSEEEHDENARAGRGQ